VASVFADAGLLSAAAVSNPLAPRAPHFTPRAKRLIFLFMNGAPSHVDTFDPKPALARHAGQPVPKRPQAQPPELFPAEHVAGDEQRAPQLAAERQGDDVARDVAARRHRGGKARAVGKLEDRLRAADFDRPH